MFVVGVAGPCRGLVKACREEGKACLMPCPMREGPGGGGGEGVVAAQTSPPLTAVERKTNGCGRGWKASGESPRWAAPNLHFPHPTTRAVTGGHRRVDSLKRLLTAYNIYIILSIHNTIMTLGNLWWTYTFASVIHTSEMLAGLPTESIL